IGKTAFLRAVANLAAERGFATAVGNCAEGASHTSYAPLRAAVRAMATAYGDRTLTDVVLTTPALGALIPASLRPDSTVAHPADVGPLYDAVLELVGSLAGERPLFFGLDDLQWADRSTLELLSFLVRNMASERMVLFGTARSADDLLKDAG